ncbi:MAG TPA: M50 family metallopeptidase [Candidatus Saccharimonadales bacterium]|nr:M50 family metallopeptidase [Candidatus Saccharimonadales bacterium]
MSILLLILGIVLFILLVVTHELGHFWVARRNGVVAEEFGVFFPPRIYKRQMKGWLFSVGLLPLGGFVKLKGEHDSDTAKGSFGAASLWVKTKIMLAGIIVNIVTALVLLTILAVIGLPDLIPHQFTVDSDTKTHVSTITAKDGKYFNIDKVIAGSAAQKAGIKKGDHLLAIGPAGHVQAVNDPDGLGAVTKKLAGQKVSVELKRKDHKLTVQATIPTAKQLAASHQKGYLGIESSASFSNLKLRHSTWSAPVVAVGFSAQATALTFEGLGHALGGLGSLIAGTVTGNHAAREHGQTAASSQVAGPVGVFAILQTSSSLGYQFVLFIIAIVALTLGIMNLLPIPALDGGRLWLMLISRAFGRPLTASLEEGVNAVGFLLIIALAITITYVDIHRFF